MSIDVPEMPRKFTEIHENGTFETCHLSDFDLPAFDSSELENALEHNDFDFLKNTLDNFRVMQERGGNTLAKYWTGLGKHFGDDHYIAFLGQKIIGHGTDPEFMTGVLFNLYGNGADVIYIGHTGIDGEPLRVT